MAQTTICGSYVLKELRSLGLASSSPVQGGSDDIRKDKPGNGAFP